MCPVAPNAVDEVERGATGPLTNILHLDLRKQQIEENIANGKIGLKLTKVVDND